MPQIWQFSWGTMRIYHDNPWHTRTVGRSPDFETQSFLPILQLLPGLQINWQPSPRPFLSRQNISNHKHHFKLYEQVSLNRQKVAFTLGPCSIQPPQWPAPSGHVPITSSLCQDASLAAEGAQLNYHANGNTHFEHGSLNVPIEHHPTIRYMVYNGYYKVMSNIPKMGQLPTPVEYWIFEWQLGTPVSSWSLLMDILG
jgi:hypothetical protein